MYLFLLSEKGGGDDSSGQRYSADPTGLLSDRGAKGDQEGYMAAVRDKKISGDLVISAASDRNRTPMCLYVLIAISNLIS